MANLLKKILADFDLSRATEGFTGWELSAQIVPGAVFTVHDKDVHLGDPRTRNFHHRRWLIVTSSAEQCSEDKIKSVWVVPCSTQIKNGRDYLLIEGEDSPLPSRSVALLREYQEIPKADLVTYQGKLSDDLFVSLLGRLEARRENRRRTSRGQSSSGKNGGSPKGEGE